VRAYSPPCIREINDIRYANDGDWVEHQTALAELSNRMLQLLYWENGSLVDGTMATSASIAA
jgi:hypothetical protein